jgi:signal transduction histidine kinase
VERTRVLLVSAVSAAITLAAALFPPLNVAYRIPDIRIATFTAALLIAVLTGFLVVGRFLRRPRLTELTLACSLATFALSELIFLAVPVVANDVWKAVLAWSALVGASFGAGLFALTAFVPRRRLIRPGVALAWGAGVVSTALAAIIALAVSFAGRLPEAPVAAPGVLGRSDPSTDAGLLTLEVAVAAVYGLAALGFLWRSEQPHDNFFGWLAVAAVLAAAAHINYLFYPSLYSPFVSLGDDGFRLCFYVLLLTGSAREIWSYWQTMSQASVQEERQRIARDLHDGLAQELAYLLRNLKSVDGTIDSQMKGRLQGAAERAQAEARAVMSMLTDPRRQPVNVAIGQAVGEVAARDHIRVELDVVPVMELPPARAEALVRIACEAVGNAGRHSGAAKVRLSLRRQGSRVQLCVSDNGSGFDPEAPSGSFGLTSMRDRASSVGGDLRISSQPGHGTEVEAML